MSWGLGGMSRAFDSTLDPSSDPLMTKRRTAVWTEMRLETVDPVLTGDSVLSGGGARELARGV